MNTSIAPEIVSNMNEIIIGMAAFSPVTAGTCAVDLGLFAILLALVPWVFVTVVPLLSFASLVVVGSVNFALVSNVVCDSSVLSGLISDVAVELVVSVELLVPASDLSATFPIPNRDRWLTSKVISFPFASSVIS